MTTPADLPDPDRLVALPDGRRLAVDDRGAPEGTPVLYLHGTPDSRLARHPDDGIANDARVRLLAVDRPGIGHSDPDPDATPVSVAADLAALLDHLGIERCPVVAWSAGSLFALALAGAHPRRVSRLVLAAPLVPADAYRDESVDVLDGSGDSRRFFASLLDDLPAGELGAELALFLAPPECDRATAAGVLADSLERLADVSGAGDMVIDALCSSVRQGTDGLAADIAAQALPLGDLLDSVDAPVSVHVGADDTTCPPVMGRWLAQRLGARVETHAGGHEIAITRWRELLADATSV